MARKETSVVRRVLSLSLWTWMLAAATARTTIAPPAPETALALPPPELGPPPTPDDAPVLEAAGAKVLAFSVRFDCPDHNCPETVFWSYRKLGEENWTSALRAFTHPFSESGVHHFDSTTTLWNLTSDTEYEVIARPLVRGPGEKLRFKPWNSSPSEQLPIMRALTCSQEVSGVRELAMHSAGDSWLALSWLPPAPACAARLEYNVRFATPLRDSVPAHAATSNAGRGGEVQAEYWRWAGRFWSSFPTRVEGRVAPCAAWPRRHCLLIAHGLLPNHHYFVKVQVERLIDKRTSQPQEVEGWTRNDMPPGEPERLQCFALGATALEISWRPPLRPGGRLALARLRVSAFDADGDADEDADGDDNSEADSGARSRYIELPVALRLGYVHQVKDLRPSTRYFISVQFVTAAGAVGAEVSTDVWTPPCDVSVFAASGAQSPAPPPPGAQASPAPRDDWLWLGGTLTAFALLPIAFVIGCRSGKRLAAISPKDEKFSTLLEARTTPGSGPTLSEEPLYFYASSAAKAPEPPPPRSPGVDLGPLYFFSTVGGVPPTPPSPPPRSPCSPAPALAPPLISLEYAEPHASAACPMKTACGDDDDSWGAYAYPCDCGKAPSSDCGGDGCVGGGSAGGLGGGDNGGGETGAPRASWHHYEDVEATARASHQFSSAYAEVCEQPSPQIVASVHDLYAQVKKPRGRRLQPLPS